MYENPSDRRTGEVAISVQGVSKVYDTRSAGLVTALDTVSLDIPQGSFTSLVGPSGCGKSTLLKMILGQETPSDGQIKIRSKSNRIGTVFQQPLLLPWRTVTENIQLSHDLNPRIGKRELRDLTAEMLRMLGLEKFATSYPFELSGGMQQRVGIGRALLHQPDILLMDEPFGALDAMTRDEMALELLRIWSQTNTTVVFVTHSISEAVILSDQIAVMTPRPGRLKETIDVALERPRKLADMDTPQFTAYVHHVRDLLGVG